MRILHFIVFGLIISASGCEKAERESSASTSLLTRVDTVDGIPWVLNSGIPETWPLEEVLQLGSTATLGEPAPDEFGRVSSAVLGPNDRIYVADGLNFEVRVFDSGGDYEFRFGRSGEGPGEFGALYSLAWLGDTLLSLDFGLGRVGLFDVNGEWLGQYRHPGRISGSGRQLRFYQTSPNEAYVWSLETDGNELTRVFIRYTADGPNDTIPAFSLDPSPQSMVICDPGDGSIHFWTIPYATRVVQHPLQDRLRAVAVTDEYRIAFIDPAGDTIRVIERVQEPVEADDGVWEEGLREYREFKEENPGVSCEPRSLRKPDVIPPIADFLADPAGNLWVQSETPDGPFWEVFDGDGILLGRVPDFPRGEQTTPYFRDRRILNVVSDSLGVETVHLYRYFRPGG